MQLDRDSIISNGSALSPSLQVFGRLGALLNKPDTELEQIVALVRLDQALTFQVIKFSNSVMFGLKNHCKVLDEAVQRLGFREIHRIVGLAATQQTFQHDLVTYGLAAKLLWENSIATAIAMDQLAVLTKRDRRAAYTTGLLRNLGKVIISKIGGARYPGEATAPDVAEWEKQTFGVTSAEVTAVILEHWGFPDEMALAVRQHLDPLTFEPISLDACILNLSAGLAETAGVRLPGEAPHWDLVPEKSAKIALNEKAIADCATTMQAEFAVTRNALN